MKNLVKKIKTKPIYFFENEPNISYADGTKVEHKNLKSQQELKSELIVILSNVDGEKITFKSRAIKYQDKLFIAPLPNPVHILLNSGIENFNYSLKTLELLKKDCNLSNEKNEVHILNINLDNTNENFNNLIKFKMTSVISLVTSLEAFLNQVVPNDFCYLQSKNGTDRKLNKKKIESPQVTFKEKSTILINQLLSEPNFSTKNGDIIKLITELYDLRKEMIHLKTYGDNEMELYFKSIGKLLDIELEQIIDSIKKYMNLIKPNFV